MSKILHRAALAGVIATSLWSAATATQAAAVAAPADAEVSGVTVMMPKVVHKSLYGLTQSDVGMSVRVPVGDLNLKTAAGRQEFDRRVDEAANLVCRMLNAKYPSGVPDEFGCKKQALEDVETQVVAALGPG